MQKIFYKGREKIIEGFKNGIFPLIKEDFHSNSQRPDLSATSNPSIDKSHGLADKELRMFLQLQTLFSYKNPEELEQALMRADTEGKYYEFLNDLNIRQIVLRDQIRTITGVSRTKLQKFSKCCQRYFGQGRIVQ